MASGIERASYVVQSLGNGGRESRHGETCDGAWKWVRRGTSWQRAEAWEHDCERACTSDEGIS